MKKYILYMLFAFSFIPAKGFSQLCGEGTLTFNIYTLNGTEISEFNYEILPVSQALLDKNFYDKAAGNDEVKRNELINEAWKTGTEIPFALAADIVDTQDATLSKKLKESLDGSNLHRKGKIKSSLVLQTKENLNIPVVLKISQGKKNIYLLGYYLGGCDREVALIWGNNAIKLK